jgi:hypothetical protein
MSETITHFAIWNGTEPPGADDDIDWQQVEIFDLIAWYELFDEEEE